MNALMTPNQKMLTPQEEITLIQDWFTHREERTLLKIVKSFSPLVYKHARMFALYGIPKEELISVGNLALVESLYGFKPEKGFKFATFASHWIRGMMLIFIAANYFSFSLKSQKLKKIFFSLRRILYTEQRQTGVDMGVLMERMARDFGVSRTKLDEIYALIRSPSTSIHQPVDSSTAASPGDMITLGDTLTNNEPDPETVLIDGRLDSYRKDLIHSTMHEVLKERERIIITGQMLMEEGQEKTLQDLADEFGLSRERVRQIRNNAFQKLEIAIREKCRGIEPQAIF